MNFNTNRVILIILGLFLFGKSQVHAQFAKSPFVIRDPRVDILVDKQIELNREALRVKTVVIQGYRIQVVSTNNRDMAFETKAKLLKYYPNQKTYMLYQSPNFKIHFGNFKTYKEAQDVKKEMVTMFGEDILVVPSKVEMKGEVLLRENNQL